MVTSDKDRDTYLRSTTAPSHTASQPFVGESDGKPHLFALDPSDGRAICKHTIHFEVEDHVESDTMLSLPNRT